MGRDPGGVVPVVDTIDICVFEALIVGRVESEVADGVTIVVVNDRGPPGFEDAVDDRGRGGPMVRWDDVSDIVDIVVMKMNKKKL